MSNEATGGNEHSDRDRPWTDAEALRELYAEQGMTMAEIGERYGCHETTVLRWLREFGISTRNPGAECSDTRLDDPDELRRLHHDERLTAEEIADRLGCNRKTVLRRLREFDIPARSRPTNNCGLTESTLAEWYINQRLTAGEIGNRVGCSAGAILDRLRRFDIPVRTQGAPEAVADANSLRQLYTDERLTVAEIADETECHTSTVRRHLRTNDIAVRPPGPDTGVREKLEDTDLLRELYVDLGQSAGSIGERFGCGGETVLRWLKRHEIPIRQPGSQTPWPRLEDESYLRQQYIEKDRLTGEIAEDVGCEPATVRRWLHIHDIEVSWEPLTGEDCPAYIDGRSRDRNYGGAVWQRARRKAFRRDDHECQRCGADEDEHLAEYGRGLEVHHITPFRTFDNLERAHRLSNLITLCRPCHKTMEKLPIDNRHAEA
jgi:DNA-directed RNA polymerase specialized sigma24 family protein